MRRHEQLQLAADMSLFFSGAISKMLVAENVGGLQAPATSPGFIACFVLRAIPNREGLTVGWPCFSLMAY